MVDERVNHVPSVDIPHSDGRIGRSRNDNPFIVLETKHRAGMSVQNASASQRVSVPNLYRIVSQTGHNFCVVILKAVNALGVLGPTIDALKVVLAAPPVVLYGIYILDDWRVQPAIEVVRGVVLAGLGFEQVLNPASSFYDGNNECF